MLFDLQLKKFVRYGLWCVPPEIAFGWLWGRTEKSTLFGFWPSLDNRSSCDSIFLSLSSSSQCLLDTSNLNFCGDGFALESHLPTFKIPAFQKRSCDEPIVEALRSLQLRIQIGKIYAWMRMYKTASSDDSSFSKFVWIDKDRESLLWICGLATCVCTANYATEEMTQVGNLIHESIGPHFLLNRWGSQSKVSSNMGDAQTTKTRF